MIPYVVDLYLHRNGTLMTVIRERFWRRAADGDNWAKENEYDRVPWPRLRFGYLRHGFTAR